MSLKGISFYALIISILSILITNEKIYYLYLLVFFIMFLIIKKYNFKVALILLIIPMFFSCYKLNSVNYCDDYVEQEFIVDEVKTNYLIVKENNIKYLIYVEDNITYYKKDVLFIKGEVTNLSNDLELDVFDFADYLKNKRVFYKITPYNIEIKSTNNNLANKIINFLTSCLTNESYNMTKMLIFNDKSANIDSYNNLKQINAVHLFVVSGFHISFLFNLIYTIFKKSKIGKIIGISVCFLYVFLLEFSISSFRALLSLFLAKFFSKYFNKLDYIGIPGILILLMEPLSIYNYSFIMSFLLTAVITLSSKILSNKNKVLQTIILSFICFLTMIPIQLMLNYEINLISLITNIILSYVVMVIFVLCIIGMVLSFINGNLFGFIYKFFFEIIDKLASLNSTLLFGNMNKVLIIIYYILLILFLYFFEKKNLKSSLIYLFNIFVLMFCLYNRGYFNISQKVTFLNVYQGDCCVIQDSLTNKVMLIDTGGLINYDIASKKIIPYLKYHGIRKIDKVVITHPDYDHNGALESLKSQIKIDEIIDDYYIKEVNLGKINLLNINTYFNDKSSENDCSIVLYGNICNKNFLFTGDISKEIEKQIIDNENIAVDILKVAHHGSKTSTCEEFINHIKPTYAIISVGKNNFYGHPNEEVINILNKNDVKVYRTDINGSIRFKGNLFYYFIVEMAKSNE